MPTMSSASNPRPQAPTPRPALRPAGGGRIITNQGIAGAGGANQVQTNPQGQRILGTGVGPSTMYSQRSVAPAPTPAPHPWQPFIDAAVKAHTGFNSLIQRMMSEFQSQVHTGNAQPGGPGAMQPFQGMKQPGVDVIRGAEKKILGGK